MADYKSKPRWAGSIKPQGSVINFPWNGIDVWQVKEYLPYHTKEDIAVVSSIMKKEGTPFTLVFRGGYAYADKNFINELKKYLR